MKKIIYLFIWFNHWDRTNFNIVLIKNEFNIIHFKKV